MSLIWNYVLKFIVFFVTYLRWISIFDELRVAIILNLSKMLDFRSNLSVGINDSLNFKFRTVGAGGAGRAMVSSDLDWPYLNWWADYDHHFTTCNPPPPQIFRPSYGPWILNQSKKTRTLGLLSNTLKFELSTHYVGFV